ncbi:carbohydrate ABC transporter permease [Allobranchiibius sp. CTAmp26]|uniref:carbohydrate ABC transporter permease n=1 Tax=Allobranchiibius sp. CTAmp26 TaxID=2815214 RepID=UPI001AA18F3D|nr:sugar ABC transporter permease [Allobranchiibius sp. CTAmp26]MBO1754472.1 sugar ABC transporter permease [Allobranchiibius sp. CTAmp26]
MTTASLDPTGAVEASTAPPGADPETKRRARREGWKRRLPLMPAFVFVIIMTQLPFLATIFISFSNWTAFSGNKGFAGLDNFKTVFQDSDARSAVVTTIELTLLVVLISLVLGIVIALLLDRTFRGRGIVRTMMIAPFLIVPEAAALVWKHALFNVQSGLINGSITQFYNWFGLKNPPQPDWITSHPLGTIVTALVWQWTPFMMLIMLAGLQGRPMDIIEAAQVDGANTWQIFTKMTLPHMRRYIELAGLLGAIYIVQNFEYVYTITSGGQNTANLPYYIQQTFFAGTGEYGVASAAGVVVVIGTIVIATFALRTVLTVLKEES